MGAVTIQGSPSSSNWTLSLPTGPGSAGESLQTDGSGNTSWASLPTTQLLTSGTAATYTPPAGVAWIEVFMVAGGGGGAGANSSSLVAGNNGTDSIFNGIHATAGSGAPNTGAGGIGGTGGTGTATRRQPGSPGGGGNVDSTSSTVVGGTGGSSYFGGGGVGSADNSAGANAAANTGAGGGGGADNSSGVAAGGGGSGEFVYLLITSPTTYLYTIGNSGTGGSASGSGGNGGSGFIFVIEHYGS